MNQATTYLIHESVNDGAESLYYELQQAGSNLVRLTLYGNMTKRCIETRGKNHYRSIGALRDFIQTTSSLKLQPLIPSKAPAVDTQSNRSMSKSFTVSSEPAVRQQCFEQPSNVRHFEEIKENPASTEEQNLVRDLQEGQKPKSLVEMYRQYMKPVLSAEEISNLKIDNGK